MTVPSSIVVLLSLAAAVPGRAQERPLEPFRVRPSPVFQATVDAGSRTMTGTPGEGYWQQQADYDIEVAVEPPSRLLTGRETITYHNDSPDTLGDVFFHLYQSLLSEDAVRTRFVPITGGMMLDRLEVDGVPRELDPEDRSETVIVGTTMIVKLPQPLPPGGMATFEVDWHFTIPAGEDVPRMGMIDSTTGQIAQWYPQIATYDDLSGWDTRQYLSDGEFYLEYGTFDLAVTVPAGTIVAATGTLQNPKRSFRPRSGSGSPAPRRATKPSTS